MNKTIFFLLILLCAAATLRAQEEALTKTVEVSRAYEPTIPEAYKINPIPRIDDSSEVTAKFTYPLRQVKPLDEDYLINPIPPARIQREQYDVDVEKLRGGYVRLGLGLKPTTLLDAYYGTQRSRRFVWNFFANHNGSYGKIKNAASEKVPNLNTRNEVGASGQYNFRSGLLYGKVGFRRHDLSLYGYATDFLSLDDYRALPNDLKRQAYNHAHMQLAYQGFDKPDSSWAYGAKFGFYDHRSRMGQAEQGLEFSLFGRKKVSPTTKLGLTLNTDVYLRSKALSNLGNTLVAFIPEATELRDKWEATVKVNLTFDNVSGSGGKMHFYPLLNFTALLADEAFCPYVEVSGEHTANTYKLLTYENHYLAPTIYFDQDSAARLRNKRQVIAFQGGIKGHIGSMIGYDLSLATAYVDNMHFFVNTLSATGTQLPAGKWLINTFDLAYDNVRQTSFRASLRYQPRREMVFKFGMRYDTYSMTNLAAPYHRPALSMKLEARYYALDNDLCINMLANVNGKYKTIAASAGGAVVEERKGAFDLSVGADYRFTDRSSVFLQLRNLTNSHYQIFNNYPTYGTQVVLGYTHIF